MSILISVELNYISLWPALSFSLLDSPGPPHLVLGTCWCVLGMDVRNSRYGWICTKTRWVLVTSLWDLTLPPGILWLAGFRAGLTSVPSHLPLSPPLGLLPRSSTIYLCFLWKCFFPLFLLNLVLNNLKSLPDLFFLSYLSGVFCLFPLSVLSHHHLDLFSRHLLPRFGVHQGTSANFGSAALTCTSKATVRWPLQSRQMLGFVCVYVAVSRSSEVQAGAKLLLTHVPGVLRLPMGRGGAWFLWWTNWSTNNAHSHQMFTETVHKIYVCFTALGLQWSLFPYFRKSLNLAGKTYWTSPEGLSLPS